MYRSGCDLVALHTHMCCESDVSSALDFIVKPFDMVYNLVNVELTSFYYRKKPLIMGLELIERRKNFEISMHCQDKGKDTYVHRYFFSRKITLYLCNESTDI
jgi:hypothetical protein